MEPKRKEELLIKYQQGNIKKAELEELFSWYNREAAQRKDIDEEDMQLRLERIAQRLPFSDTQRPIHSFSQSLWLRWTAAAICIGAIGISLWLLQLPQSSPKTEQSFSTIVPDQNAHATWTNEEGQDIDLTRLSVKDTLRTNGLIVYKNKDGFLTYKPLVGQDVNDNLQTIQTPPGSNVKLLLADGTRVWLNSASTLRFPVDMTQGDRQVEVEGEAYFEVAKLANEQGQRKNFRVYSDRQLIEVLGTKFNIKNYQEDIYGTTSLYEGSIRLETKFSDHSGNNSVLLKPGQQSILNKSSAQLDFKTLKDLDEQSWREGYFNFDGEPIQDVCQQLARWYPVNFEIDPSIPSGEYHGSISKSYSLNEVLNILTQNKLRVEFKNKNDQIIVRLKQK